MPPRPATSVTYAIVYVLLLALLAISALVARLPAGAWSSPAALAIAAVKTALVFWFFMKLRDHPGLPRIVAVSGLFWLGLLLVLALADYLTRNWLF